MGASLRREMTKAALPCGPPRAYPRADLTLRNPPPRIIANSLGMKLVLRQPNLDEPRMTHLFFSAGNGAFLAFVTQQSPDKPRFIRAVRELIEPRGWCTILEWYRKETEGGPPLDNPEAGAVHRNGGSGLSGLSRGSLRARHTTVNEVEADGKAKLVRHKGK